MEKAGLTKDATYTRGNIIRLLQAAFKDYMPELVGQRVYNAIINNQDEAVITTPEVQSAVDWIAEYGLCSDFLDETKIMTTEELDIILARFYQYFGTNEKDDFTTANNYGFYFYDEDDEGINSKSFYTKTKLVDSSVITDTCISKMKELIGSDSKYSSRYKGALDYLEGEADYTFLEEDDIDEEIASCTDISIDTDWLTTCSNMFKNYGCSPYYDLETLNYLEDEDGTRHTTLDISCGAINMTGLELDKEETVTNI